MTTIDSSSSFLKKLSVTTAGTALAFIGVIGLWCKEAQASFTTSGCASPDQCNLQELFDGGTITIEDKIFNDWSFFGGFIDKLVPPDFSLIDVIPLDDDPLNPGLKFNANGQLSIVDEEVIEIDLGFMVTTLDGSTRIKDNSLALTDFEFGADSDAFINIDESVFDENFNRLGRNFVVADPFAGNFGLFDSVDFAPQSSIFVTKNIFIQGNDSGVTGSINVFEQRFSQKTVLEPSFTLGLLALGTLGGVSALKRKLRRQPFQGG